MHLVNLVMDTTNTVEMHHMLTATETQWRHARFSTPGAKVGLGGGRDNGVKPIQSAMVANSFP